MDKYLSGNIETIFGDVKILVFKNEGKKEGSNQPDYNIVTKKGDKLKRIGALWLTKKKPKPEQVEEEAVF